MAILPCLLPRGGAGGRGGVNPHLSALLNKSMGKEEDYRRAIEYPYSRHDNSFVFHRNAGAVETLSKSAIDEAWNSSRVAVLAIGSNAAPAQLKRKFWTEQRLAMGEETIPVLAASLLDWDVVYAAAMAAYGSIPATITRSAGTKVRLFVTMLTESQLEAMHTTERAYYFVQLSSPTVSLDDLGAPVQARPIFAYIAKRGPLLSKNNTPHALEEIAASNRKYPATSQLNEQVSLCEYVQSLANLRDRSLVKDDEDLTTFVLGNIQNAERRSAIVEELRPNAADLAYDLRFTDFSKDVDA